MENFFRFRIFILGSRSRNINISAVLYTDLNKEYVFMPDIVSPELTTTYPERSINCLTKVGEGEYQFFFYPKDEKPTKLRVLADIDNVIFDRSFRLEY
ncbi:MAG: hypothetical protein U9P44_00790 [archaeon]|nr:hypothetical protein [archaeon]